MKTECDGVAESGESHVPHWGPTTTRGKLTIVAVALIPLVVVAGALASWFSFLDSGFGFEDLMAEWHQTMIAENVPEPEQFDRLLTRDLDSYFVERFGQDVTVTYELLRDVPTQSGTSCPKYYAWVRVFEGSALVEEGVVRVGVLQKEHFDVTHYFTADEVRQNPERIEEVFADDVVQKILERLE